jgi:hypothetical protein
LARVYKPRPEQDRVAPDETPPTATAGVGSFPVPASETPGDPYQEQGVRSRGDGHGAAGLKSGSTEGQGTGQSPAGDCWECRLTVEVHRHNHGGGLWQEGYRVPCKCGIVGGMVNGTLWDAFWYGHHYECIWWSFQEREAKHDEVFS